MKAYCMPFVIMGLFALLTLSLTESVSAQPHHGRGFWTDLTDEQKEAIHNKITELRDQGATREEIHEAISIMLEEFGFDLPEKGDGPHGPFGPHQGPLWEDLNMEQREAIRNKINEMRDQGATREEIHAAVNEMLEGHGIEFPKDSENQSSKTPSADKHIVAHNYPNPFNPETYINYTLDVSGDVRIQIYNIAGQVIRSYTVGYQQPGSYSVLWDGHDKTGSPVASGVYFYRIEAGPYAIMNRMMFLK